MDTDKLISGVTEGIMTVILFAYIVLAVVISTAIIGG